MNNQSKPNPQPTDLPTESLENRPDMENTVYAGLGVNNEPDVLNPGNDEATDTVLHTDTATARHATDEVSNSEDMDELPTYLTNSDLSDDELDEQITELAEEEDEGNERY